MNYLLSVLLLLTSSFLSDKEDPFLSEFSAHAELQIENRIDEYKQLDFSPLWMSTENQSVFGIIGDDHQRIKMKFISITQDQEDQVTYTVTGKSNVKNNICDFTGTIRLFEVRLLAQMEYGVDDMYKDDGITDQGVLIASYSFKEEHHQSHSGVFEGKLYTRWYVKGGEVFYDDITSSSDGYYNNAHVGIWKMHNSDYSKVCNWADGRVPECADDFDLGAGDFSPSDKYLAKGWNTYREAWFNNDEASKEKERENWWGK